jgi:NADH dehydrogenase FAD-containing subunit
MHSRFVIIGASLTGASAAATLRQVGFDGDVILIGAEQHLPYERPPLSKQYLRGEIAFEKALVRSTAFYEQNRIELLLGVRATSVQPVDRLIHLDVGRKIRYDKLLIATGVRNRRPSIPGLDLPGVFDLRTVSDADALRNAKLAYQRYLTFCRTPAWHTLAAKGAHPQRLLWASTSTKNVRYRDVRYVEELIGRDTVTTVTPKTIDARVNTAHDRQTAR